MPDHAAPTELPQDPLIAQLEQAVREAAAGSLRDPRNARRLKTLIAVHAKVASELGPVGSDLAEAGGDDVGLSALGLPGYVDASISDLGDTGGYILSGPPKRRQPAYGAETFLSRLAREYTDAIPHFLRQGEELVRSKRAAACSELAFEIGKAHERGDLETGTMLRRVLAQLASDVRDEVPAAEAQSAAYHLMTAETPPPTRKVAMPFAAGAATVAGQVAMGTSVDQLAQALEGTADVLGVAL